MSGAVPTAGVAGAAALSLAAFFTASSSDCADLTLSSAAKTSGVLGARLKKLLNQLILVVMLLLFYAVRLAPILDK